MGLLAYLEQLVTFVWYILFYIADAPVPSLVPTPTTPQHQMRSPSTEIPGQTGVVSGVLKSTYSGVSRMILIQSHSEISLKDQYNTVIFFLNDNPPKTKSPDYLRSWCLYCVPFHHQLNPNVFQTTLLVHTNIPEDILYPISCTATHKCQENVTLWACQFVFSKSHAL